MFTLESPFLSLGCDPVAGIFSIQSAGQPFYFVEGGRMCVVYRLKGQRFSLLEDGWRLASDSGVELVDTVHGPVQQVQMWTTPDRNGLSCKLTFAVAQHQPLMLWKASLTNDGPAAVEVLRVEMLRAGRGVPGSRVTLTRRGLARPAFFSNGWQSWTYSATYTGDQPARLRVVDALVDGLKLFNPDTPRPRSAGHYGSDFFGVIGDRLNRSAWLAGFLSQRQQFGSLEAWTNTPAGLRLWANGDAARLDPGQVIETDWAVLQPVEVDQPDPLGSYTRAVAREHDCPPSSEPPVGWCSWYYYYQNLSAEKVRQNLRVLEQARGRLPVGLAQIDDGFERQVGDWFEFSPGFPDGVMPLAAETRAAGLTPGLWLAPFIVHPGARLAREHREYILRDGFGRPAPAGFNWGAWNYGLDLTTPGALNYVCQVVETAAKEWGFSFLKLDFLYAGGLPGRRFDPRLTRAQALRVGLEAIRSVVGKETYLLGCGVPLGSAIGVFDAMRIGTDVSGAWEPDLLGVRPYFRGDPHLASVRNAAHNTLARATMHGRWWVNDPDCLLVRPDSKLTLDEVKTWASLIALTGGSLLLSDDLTALPDERMRIVEKLLPVMGQRAEVLDWFDRETPQYLRLDCSGAEGDWHLLAWINWADEPGDFLFRPANFNLPDDNWWLRSFWDGRTELVRPGSMLTFPGIAPHGVVLLAARAQRAGEAQYLGGNLHISQGLEVTGWQSGDRGVSLRLTLPRVFQGQVELCLPERPACAWANGAEVACKPSGEGRYEFEVKIDQEGELRVAY